MQTVKFSFDEGKTWIGPFEIKEWLPASGSGKFGHFKIKPEGDFYDLVTFQLAEVLVISEASTLKWSIFIEEIEYQVNLDQSKLERITIYYLKDYGTN